MSNLIRQSASNAAAPLTYTGSFVDKSAAAVTAQVIFTPAANVNGAYVEYVSSVMFATAGNGETCVSIIAKSSAPASDVDGDVIYMSSSGYQQATTVAAAPVVQTQAVRVKIAAGKGLYLNQTTQTNPATRANKTVLYTLL